MKIQKIEIKGLFDQFDYEIPLANHEDLLILTAPNGFGKTMILNIINSLFNKNFSFFQKLVFKQIVFYFDTKQKIEIIKEKRSKININLYEGKEVTKHQFMPADEDDMVQIINYINNKYYSLNLLDDGLWQNESTNEIITLSEIVERFKLPNYIVDKYKKLFNFPKSINAFFELLPFSYLIEEQRLIQEFDEYTITQLAEELSENTTDAIVKGAEFANSLDSTFPKRLLSETKQLDEKEFTSRFKTLQQNQAKLKKYGLSESEQEIPVYSKENARLLSVYLSDIEQKISFFDTLIRRLHLFTSIINEHFTFKSIKINKEKGFFFVTNKGKELSLTDLSSGEQHEVVLLYELIFRTTPDTLVLIDEPEISLHITWQKEFLKDILAIIALQKMQVIVATHSPQIINDRWDLVFNLETQEMQ